VTLLSGDASTHSFRQDDGISADFDGTATESVQSAPLEPDAVSVSHTPAYVLWGIGAVSAAVTTVLFLESGRLQNEADDEFARRCPQGLDPTDDLCMRTTAMDARAARWRTATVLTGVGAGSALVGGTVLYWLDLRSASQSGKSKPGSMGAWVSPAGVGLYGMF
jgi:hypothetical protein